MATTVLTSAAAPTAMGLAVCLAASLFGVTHGQAPRATIALDPDDIGGVVTSERGAEAGAWVIAETTDLPTKFVRIVVTDDQGRYVVPDLPKASYTVWARGYGLVDGPKVQATPGRMLNLVAVTAPNPRAAAEYYPAGYWLSLIRVPAKDEFPGTGGQRNQPCHPKPGRVAEKPEVRRMHRVSSARHRRNTRAAEVSRLVRLVGGRVAAADSVGTSGNRHDQRHQPARAESAHALRGLDRSHRSRRGPADAAASTRSRTQRRDHRMGLGRSEGVPARRGLDRSTQADPECQRADLRRPRAQRRLCARPRSGASHDQPNPVDGARPQYAGHIVGGPAAVALLGERRHLDQQEQRAQPDARRARSGVAHVGGPAARQPCLLQGRIDASIREALSHRAGEPSSRDVRPGQPEAHAHQHLLRHASPDVRRGREQHAVDERRRPGGRLARQEDVRGNRRRGEVAGMDRPRHGHQRQREARRVRRARSAGRSGKGQTIRRRLLRRLAGAGWFRLGLGARFSGRGHPAEPGFESARDGARGSLRAAGRQSARGRPWLLAAWDGHRSQRRRLGGARERAPRELRSTQVQGSAERPRRDRAALPRRLDALSGTAAADRGRNRLGERRGELLHLGRSVRHAGPGRERPDQHGQCF